MSAIENNKGKKNYFAAGKSTKKHQNMNDNKT